jgi:carboxylesterase
MTTPDPQASRGAYHSTKLPVTGVLLVHGYNGCLSDMAEIEAALQAYGMVTKNMLLPGHGVHVREMMPVGWEDWAQAVHQEVKLL